MITSRFFGTEYTGTEEDYTEMNDKRVKSIQAEIDSSEKK